MSTEAENIEADLVRLRKRADERTDEIIKLKGQIESLKDGIRRIAHGEYDNAREINAVEKFAPRHPGARKQRRRSRRADGARRTAHHPHRRGIEGRDSPHARRGRGHGAATATGPADTRPEADAEAVHRQVLDGGD